MKAGPPPYIKKHEISGIKVNSKLYTQKQNCWKGRNIKSTEKRKSKDNDSRELQKKINRKYDDKKKSVKKEK